MGYGCIVGGRDCSGLTTDIEMNDYDVDVASARISYDICRDCAPIYRPIDSA